MRMGCAAEPGIGAERVSSDRSLELKSVKPSRRAAVALSTTALGMESRLEGEPALGSVPASGDTP